jgi:hypothetical protein
VNEASAVRRTVQRSKGVPQVDRLLGWLVSAKVGLVSREPGYAATMAKTRKPLVMVAAGGLVAGVRAAARKAQAGRRGEGSRWVAVTVLQPPSEVIGSAALAPLEALGAAAETTVSEAPGGRGADLAARWRPGHDAGRPLDELRCILREVKQVLEVGEVLQSAPRPEGTRPNTPGGLLIDAAERRSQGKGVL